MSSTLGLCITAFAWAALALSPGHAGAAEQRSQGTARVFSENPRALIETTQGNIEIELLPKFAPNHVNNFLNLVE